VGHARGGGSGSGHAPTRTTYPEKSKIEERAAVIWIDDGVEVEDRGCLIRNSRVLLLLYAGVISFTLPYQTSISNPSRLGSTAFTTLHLTAVCDISRHLFWVIHHWPIFFYKGRMHTDFITLERVHFEKKRRT
jgi:hypothetical protein